MEGRSNEVKPRTLRYYKLLADYITGPLLIGTPQERSEYKTTGKMLEGGRFKPMLGGFKVNRPLVFLSQHAKEESPERVKLLDIKRILLKV